jgi:hypothetical protein
MKLQDKSKFSETENGVCRVGELLVDYCANDIPLKKLKNSMLSVAIRAGDSVDFCAEIARVYRRILSKDLNIAFVAHGFDKKMRLSVKDERSLFIPRGTVWMPIRPSRRGNVQTMVQMTDLLTAGGESIHEYDLKFACGNVGLP